jgi:hypothetical protein
VVAQIVHVCTHKHGTESVKEAAPQARTHAYAGTTTTTGSLRGQGGYVQRRFCHQYLWHAARSLTT